MDSEMGFNKGSAALAVAAFAVAAFRLKRFGDKNSDVDSHGVTPSKDDKSKTKIGVDAVFFSRMARLLKIIVPGPLSRESMYLAFVAALLVMRTYFDIALLSITTRIETHM